MLILKLNRDNKMDPYKFPVSMRYPYGMQVTNA